MVALTTSMVWDPDLNIEREFPKTKQAHSCHPVSVESHFDGKDPRQDLFDALCGKLNSFGPLRMDAVKTGINLVPKHHMGGVRVLKDRLHVGFVLNRRIDTPRISRILQIGPSMFAHSVNISSKEDLDPELLSWLKEAYERAAHVKE